MHFHVLDEDDCARLFHSVLHCLERTGVNVLNSQARSLLAEAGAPVDGVRVRIPAGLMQKTLSSAPSGFSLYGRDVRQHMEVTSGKVHFGPGLTSSYFIDPYSGERRFPKQEDLATAARVSDALENIDYLMGLVLPDDIPPERASVYEFAEMVTHSGKPLIAWADSISNLEDIYQISVAALGSEERLQEQPLFALFAVGLGPLVHPDIVMAKVLWCAERRIPLVYHGHGVAGVSAPVTGAGSLVVNLAGCLSGLAIAQLKHPGAPVCMGAVPAPMDPYTCRPSYGSPELNLYSAAIADVARYLRLPYMGTAGASEAKCLDLQAAIESTFQVVFSLLSGTSLPHDAGFLDCADIGSLEMLVMTDEIISMARRIMRGIEINDVTLMLDLIDRVGPGGEFISTEETAHGFRREIWRPRLMDRLPWMEWTGKGSHGMQDRIRDRIQSILSTHTPLPLPEGAIEQIQHILLRDKRRLEVL
jgi:trimethylamine---corrinoid protein Co-methyltransferase